MINEVEAILFLTPRPLSAKEIAKALNTDERTVLEAIESLKERYKESALLVEEFAGRYRLNVKEKYRELGKKLGLLPEFSQKDLKVIALLMKEGEIRLSELKKRIKGAERSIEKLRSYGFVVTTKVGKSIVVKKTKLLDKYFGTTREA